jgi:hypothetical protein
VQGVLCGSTIGRGQLAAKVDAAALGLPLEHGDSASARSERDRDRLKEAVSLQRLLEVHIALEGERGAAEAGVEGAQRGLVAHHLLKHSAVEPRKQGLVRDRDDLAVLHRKPASGSEMSTSSPTETIRCASHAGEARQHQQSPRGATIKRGRGRFREGDLRPAPRLRGTQGRCARHRGGPDRHGPRPCCRLEVLVAPCPAW